jgi:hypothetical protein
MEEREAVDLMEACGATPLDEGLVEVVLPKQNN